MAKVLFGKWNEKIIELDGGKINDVEFQDKVFGVYPLKSEVSNRLWAKRWQKERGKTNLLMAFTDFCVLVWLKLYQYLNKYGVPLA